MGILNRLFSRLLLDLGAIEGEYRKEHFGVDKAQSVFVIIVAALAMLVLAQIDSQISADEPGLYSWVFRCGICYALVSLVSVLVILLARDTKTFDGTVCVWALITGFYLFSFNFVRPWSDSIVPFNVLFPFGIYLLFSLKIRCSIPLALSFSIAVILVDAFYKTGLSSAELFTEISAQALAHILALPSAIQLQSYRRRSFKAYLDQKDAREMANYLINIDALTKCMTRLYFMEAAVKEFLRARRYKLPLSLLMLDIDHFKRINDNYGHPAGDQVLQRFAAVVLEQKRAQDLFGRLGGEEFGLLLPSTTLMNANLVAERIKEMWAATPTEVDTNMIRSTVSIGVAELGPADASFDTLLHRADSMMYKAKRRGRNRVAFE